jgi:hypothetical protein
MSIRSSNLKVLELIRELGSETAWFGEHAANPRR